ncbi:SRPBCC family protein [Mycolicibacterium sp. XJ879]
MAGNTLRTAVRLGAVATLLYAARRYYRNWGTTKEEYRRWLPGDELVHRPCVWSTTGVWIDAPESAVWPALLQIGRRRTERSRPERQRLEPGDVVRLAPKGWMGLRDGFTMTVGQVLDDEAIVLCGSPPGCPFESVWSFHVEPRWEDRCRLLIRTRAQLHHPGDLLLTELAGPLIALFARRTLLTIKNLALDSMQAVDMERAV